MLYYSGGDDMRIIHAPNLGLTVMRIVGTLTIHVRDAKTGRILRTLRKRNTITYDAGDVVRGLLAQRTTDPAPGEYKFGSMRFGADNTTPTRADTDLIAEVVSVRKQLTDGQKVDGVSGEITVDATLQSGDGNGNTFQEAGVFTQGSGTYDANVGGALKMFARQVHGAIAKTAGIVFDYSWTFQFTT
jgi:hypothetical protein